MKCLKCKKTLYVISEIKGQYICTSCGAEHNLLIIEPNTKNETKYLLLKEQADKIINDFCEEVK